MSKTSRFVIPLFAICALALPMFAEAQMSVPTKGQLTAQMPEKSLILSKDLAMLRAWWVKPVHEHQKFWKDTVIGRAGMAAPTAVPAKFAEAVSAATMAKCAAFRWAMEPANPKSTEELAKVVATLKIAAVPGGSTITRPEALLNYLLAYDFIRDAPIAAADRAQIEEVLLREARSIKSGETDSNAKGKIGGTRGFAGLLLHDQALLDQALTDLNNHFKYSTTDDGWFCDSQGHYLNYTLSHLAVFARAYQQAGVDIYPNLRPYAEMSIGLRMPSGTMPNVSNGTLTPVAINLFSFAADKTLASEELWAVTSIPAGDFSAKTNVMNNDFTYTNFFALSNFAITPKPPAHSPTFLTRGQSGVSVFRNDWTATSNYLLLSPGVDSPSSKQPIYLALPPASGIMPAYHTQNDTGEVMIASRGVSIIVGAGYDRRDLSNSPKGMDPKRAHWHNVLLVDGDVGKLPEPSASLKHPEGETMIEWGGANLGRTVRPGDFTHTDRLDSSEKGEFKGVCDFATLKLAYNETEVRRSVAFPNEDYFVVADVARSAKSHQFTVNFVGRGGAPVVEKSPRQIASRWEKDKAAVIVTTVGSRELTHAGGQHWMQETYNKFEEIFRSQATAEGANASFLSVIETAEAGVKPAIKVASEPAGDGAAVTAANEQAGWIDTLFVQPGGTMLKAGAVASDAAFAYARRKGEVTQGFMIARGKSLDIAGKPVFRADKPITISAAMMEREIRATISVDEFAAGTKITFPAAGKVKNATLDGKSISATSGAEGVSVSLSAGGSLQIVFE